MKKSSRYFSILIVPEGMGKTVQFKVRSLTFKIILFTVFIFIAGSFLSIIFTGRIAAKLQMANYLALKNADLKEKNKKIEVLASELAEIKKREERIKKLTASFMKESLPLADKDVDLSGSAARADTFVTNVKKKQKTFALATAEGEASSQTRMLLAAPTLRPVDGWITRGFATKLGSTQEKSDHRGIDVAVATNTPILSAAPGVVTFAGWDKFYGKMVIVNHGFGYETVYGHCNRLLVKRSDIVDRGQTVGLVGSSGQSTAPHLHYEIHKNGSPVDPMLFFIY